MDVGENIQCKTMYVSFFQITVYGWMLTRAECGYETSVTTPGYVRWTVTYIFLHYFFAMLMYIYYNYSNLEKRSYNVTWKQS